MKKYIMFVLVLGVLIFGVSKAYAAGWHYFQYQVAGDPHILCIVFDTDSNGNPLDHPDHWFEGPCPPVAAVAQPIESPIGSVKQTVTGTALGNTTLFDIGKLSALKEISLSPNTLKTIMTPVVNTTSPNSLKTTTTPVSTTTTSITAPITSLTTNTTKVLPTTPATPNPSTSALTNASQNAVFNRTLQAGLKGTDVKALQDILISKGFLSGIADSSFGPKTTTALKAYQTANNLKADGKAGTITLNSMKSGGISIPTLPCSSLAPSIKVLSPNGGETFTPGQQITVTWTSCNIPANAQIGIGMNWPGSWNLGFGLTAMPTTNTGSATFVLPSASNFYSPGGFQYGQFYKIAVTAPYVQINNISVFDGSDNTFTINTSTTPVNNNASPFATLTNSVVTGTVNSGNLDDVGTFGIKFNILAQNGDIYLPKVASNVVSNSIMYNVNTTNNNNYEFGGLTGTVNCSSCSTTANHYIVHEGETKSFTLTVNVDNSLTAQGAGTYRMSLAGIPWNQNDSNVMYLYTPSNIGNYVTSYLYLN